MDQDLLGQIIIIAILVILSAYFSATETAFTSVNKIRLKSLASDGDKKAEKVLHLTENYDKLLTTILVGNNVVNIGVTAIATVIFVGLYGAYGPTIATIVMTVIVLIFGEITPKNIAKEKSEEFAKFSQPFIHVLMVILTPVNFVFTQWKRLISKVFKLRNENSITEDELLTIVEEAETGGSIDESHSELIQNAIEFYELSAEDVMTPRPKMVAIEDGRTHDELARIFKDTGFSRLPVYEEDIDHILGVINQKDFHNFIVGTEKKITDYVMPVVFVGTAMKISDLLKKMQQLKTHMAIVVDEYGGTEGLVTMEDIIEELVGEIFDEHDIVISKDIMPLQNGSFRVKGSANINKVFDYFEIDEEPDSVLTVNGWVAVQLDKLPARDDKFDVIVDEKRLSGRVTKADSRKAIEINLVVRDAENVEE
ncbi:MAG: HlyC/CorC family transporter [Firmicutes bacterium]|nr:HlyC/CorC family transporter [Bacillota bacterium]